MKLSILCVTATACLLTACGGSTANGSNASDEGLFTQVTHMFSHEPETTDYVGGYVFTGDNGFMEYDMELKKDSTGLLKLFMMDKTIPMNITWHYMPESDAVKISLQAPNIFNLANDGMIHTQYLYLQHDSLYQDEIGFNTKSILTRGTMVTKK